MTRRHYLLLAAGIAFVLAGTVAGAGLGPPRTLPAQWSFGRGPTVVLVHGLGSGTAHWLPVARRLAARHRVALVELPGHGLAPMPRPLTLDRAAAALDRALEQIGGEPVVLVGHSLGGLVAARAALARPQRVAGLVLVEAALSPQFSAAEAAALRRALDADPAGALRAAWVSFGRDSAQGERLWAETSRHDPRMLRAWIEVALREDLSEAAAGLRMPVLAAVSARTWPRGEAWGPTARALGLTNVATLTVERFDDCGHFVMLDRPDALADRIAAFVRAVRGEPVAHR
uniref:Alpha/beta hydrolase n=1 Tax=Eiseniibacteriota bacterium TaxID=2212470 RepID=A0A832MJ68_UNCEI